MAGLLILGVLLIAGPIVATALGVPIGGLAITISVGSGIAIVLLSAAFIAYKRLFVRAKADMAFVRTGRGGMQAVKDGGAFVIPMFHEMTWVPLRTFCIEVIQEGLESLLTKDKLRAEMRAAFYVRVLPDDSDIKAAARSLGERATNEGAIRGLILDKLTSTLRSVAAQRTLEELNSDRSGFVTAVLDLVRADIQHNGFTLETPNITKLGMAPASAFRVDDVFEAEGLRSVTAKTEQMRTEQNAITRERARERLEQDVKAKKAMLALEQEQATAEAEQGAAIAKLRAEQGLLAKQAEIGADRKQKEAELERTQAIEVRKAAAERAAEVAQQERQQGAEVAARDREIAVAQKETERAKAEADRQTALKEQEAQAQAVETVRVTAQAEREGQQRVIAAKAEAERAFVEKQRAADAAAYELKTLADGKRAAADADAEAVLKQARASAEAAELRAKGDLAVAAVPVNVRAKEVEVDGQRVTVLEREFTVREEHGAAAQEFELAKARIEAEMKVRIETARATAELGMKSRVTLVGTPEQAAAMVNAYAQGMRLATTLDGAFAGMSPNVRGIVGDAAQEALGLLHGITNHLGVRPAAPTAGSGANSGPHEGAGAHTPAESSS